MLASRSPASHWTVATLAALGLLACRSSVAAVKEAPVPSEPMHVAIEAVADHTSIGPGQVFWVAVVQRIDPGWHTYWVNPGDAGQPIKLQWSLPPGYQIRDIEWPVPQVMRSATLVTYGYEGEVTLLQQVVAPTTLSALPVQLSVEANWLVCQEACIPEHGTAKVAMQQVATGTGLAPPASMARFDVARDRLPRQSPWATSIAVHPSTVELTIRGLAAELPAAGAVRFLPLTWGQIDNVAAQLERRSGPDLVLTLARGDLRTKPLAQLHGVLVVERDRAPTPGRGYVLRAAAADAATIQ
jgi:DsbC/DsbD-like thiol-disulfide interchange protein